jgi:dTDP-4-dehydrorhamnose reductase
MADGAQPLPLWGGFECSVVRVGDNYRDQYAETGHDRREDDIDLVVDLGIRTLRYGVLWERVAPRSLNEPDWRWVDRRMAMLRQRSIEPIVGLVHHGSGPCYTDLLNPNFPNLLADYAGKVAARYPHVRMFTPVNEPLTTARLSCLYGHWFPHRQDEASFLRALFHEMKGTAAAMRAIRRVSPGAQLVQTEDLGRIFATSRLAYQARYENSRRWLSLDLLCGRVTPDHTWHARFLGAGVAEGDLQALSGRPCPPDVIGTNYYLSSDRYLDGRLWRYTKACHGGNGRHTYADIEAVRIDRPDVAADLKGRLIEAWKRYGIPIAVTEIHNGCTREEQVRWLVESYRSAGQAREEGVDVRGATVWALAGLVDWSTLLTRSNGHFECGAIETKGGGHRGTAVAAAVKALATSGTFAHPLLDGPGWWRRDMRFYGRHKDVAVPGPVSARRILVAGDRGGLAGAFAEMCDHRGLLFEVADRTEIRMADRHALRRTLSQLKVWAVVNAVGCSRSPDPEHHAYCCRREDNVAAEMLADVCCQLKMPFLTLSSHCVFDGKLGRPYTEADPPTSRLLGGANLADFEARVQVCCPHALIVRSGAVFGPSQRGSFVDRVLTTLHSGRPFIVDDEAHVSVSYLPDLVHRALDLMIDGEMGIWHLPNEGSTSWSALAKRVAASAGLPIDLVRSPGEPATSTELASRRGPVLPPVADAVERFFRARQAA